MADIDALVQKYVQKYGAGFDADAFTAAAANGGAEALNPEAFLKGKEKSSEKKDKDESRFGNVKGGFQLDFSDGKCVARGFGAMKDIEISAENAYEMFMQANKQFNKKWDAEGYGPDKRMAILRLAQNTPNREEILKDCFRAALDSNIIMNGDLPKDKEFYAQMKQEYLKDGQHTQKDWERMTRFVPLKYLQNDQEKAGVYDRGKQQPQEAKNPALEAARRKRQHSR